MRLMSVKARVPYVDLIDREPYTKKTAPHENMVGKPNPDGKPVKNATTWYFRGLTSAEEGALTDSMFDLGKTSVSPTASKEDVKVDMAMSISPSQNRRNRVQLALTGWENLFVQDADTDAESGERGTSNREYTTTPMHIGGQEFEGADVEVLDMIPQDVLRRMEEFVRDLSSVEPGAGKP